MFQKGDIVYHKRLVFKDGELDNKKNRPCIVLFEININGKEYVCTCPLTSSIDKFNKSGTSKYYMITQPVYQYKKISFAKINSLLLQRTKDTFHTGCHLNSEDFNIIVDKIKEYPFSNNLHVLLQQYLESEDKEVDSKTKSLKYKIKRSIR